MIYAAENRKSEKYYTFLPKLFDVIGNAQLKYNWLITACECNVANRIEDAYFAKGYCWISGEELAAIVRETEIQWIWAILSGFEKDIPLEKVLEHPCPDFTDGEEICGIIHPLAKVQIIAFDSSGTQIFNTEEEMVSKFRAGYPQSDDINDDSEK